MPAKVTKQMLLDVEEVEIRAENGAVLVLPVHIELLHIAPEHLDALVSLPLHHRDPFDRLLIAQSIIEGTPPLSWDRTFKDYAVQLLWELD